MAETFGSKPEEVKVQEEKIQTVVIDATLLGETMDTITIGIPAVFHLHKSVLLNWTDGKNSIGDSVKIEVTRKYAESVKML